jgi:hypothetical protein
MHMGAPQSDEGFLREHVQRIAEDPNGRWAYLGDGGECALKESKGDVYKQKYSPGDQLNKAAEILEPIRGKGLFGITGNHDRRVYKATGLDWAEELCLRLGIPYLGAAALARISIRPAEGRHDVLEYDTFWHHGKDSSSVTPGKIGAAQALNSLAEVDAVFSAHSHICLDLPPEYVAFIPPRTTEVQYKKLYNFICGCAYDSRVPGYAEDKAYKPIIPAYLGVDFYGDTSHEGTANDRKKIELKKIWRADGSPWWMREAA